MRFLLKTMPVNILLIVCSLSFFIGIAEIAIRILDHPAANIRWWELNIRAAENMQDKTDSYDYRFSTDLAGRRITPNTDNPTDESIRIAYVGDSFVFGLGIGDAETVPAQLQAMLRKENKDLSINVSNFATPGIGPYQYWKIAEKYVKQENPDLVIFGLLHYNDLLGNNPLAFRSEEEIDGSVEYYKKTEIAEKADPDPAWLKSSVLWSSAFVRFVTRSVMSARPDFDWRTSHTHWPGPGRNLASHWKQDCREKIKDIKICSKSEISWDSKFKEQAYQLLRDTGELEQACRCEKNPWLANAYVEGAGQMLTAVFPDSDTEAVMESEMRLQLAALEQAVLGLERAGIPSLITVFTAGPYVEPHLFSPIVFAGTDTGDLRKSRSMHERLGAYCAQKGWECFDPIESLHAEAAKEGQVENTLFIPADGHMTARGNRLYAAKLLPIVRAKIDTLGLAEKGE